MRETLLLPVGLAMRGHLRHYQAVNCTGDREVEEPGLKLVCGVILLAAQDNHAVELKAANPVDGENDHRGEPTVLRVTDELDLLFAKVCSEFSLALT